MFTLLMFVAVLHTYAHVHIHICSLSIIQILIQWNVSLPPLLRPGVSGFEPATRMLARWTDEVIYSNLVPAEGFPPVGSFEPKLHPLKNFVNK